MSVCSHPSEGHLMSEEVRGSEGISPRLIEKNFNGSVAGMTFLWTHIWMLLFVALGTPPPYPGQWQNTGLHLLPKWLGHGHRQARIWQLACRYVLKGSVSCSSLLIYFTLWTSKSDWFNLIQFASFCKYLTDVESVQSLFKKYASIHTRWFKQTDKLSKSKADRWVCNSVRWAVNSAFTASSRGTDLLCTTMWVSKNGKHAAGFVHHVTRSLWT